MKRPFLIITISYIIGIIWGLYYNKSIAPILLILFMLILVLYSRKNLSNKFRYIKLIIPLKVILISFITTCISNTMVIKLEYKYNNLYKDTKEANWLVIIKSLPKEKEYKTIYKVKVVKCNNSNKYNGTYLNLEIKKQINMQNLEIGDIIQFNGQFIEPEIQRNEGGYNHKNYLKTQNIYGSVKTQEKSIKMISKKANSHITRIASNIRMKIVNNISKLCGDETKDLLQGILIGYKDNMEEELKQSFRDSSLYHMLAISGTHISYIILGIILITKKLKCSRKMVGFICVSVLICFIILTGFTPSIERATIMGIITIIAERVHRKSDFLTSISISLLVILLKNPYSIIDIGLLLSFGGTIGIVGFSKPIYEHFLINSENKFIKKYIAIQKIVTYIRQVFSVSLSAQLVIIPIILIYFNKFSFTFLFTNLLAGPLIAVIIIGGIVLVFLSFIYFPLASLVGKLFEKILELFIIIAKVGSILPGSKIYFRTPNIIEICLFYSYIIIFLILYKIKRKDVKRRIEKNIYRKTNIIKKVILYATILIILVYIFIGIIPSKNLNIYFVDVGQGDCTVIVTPFKKTILIDGGGSETGDFNVGKNTVFPFLLDKGIMKIDYIIFSHFDTDHCQGLLYLMENMEVKNAIISQQGEESINYKKFLKLAESKNIKIIEVKAGDKIKIDEHGYLDILWPTQNLVKENILNNNSIVAKLYYYGQSILFTGDIEAVAENKIIQQYKNTNKLKSTIIKIAHHGSKSSTIREFILEVEPKIALIGVGKNNTFGHPNVGVLERLERMWK